jgi:NAD(P)-dependent dehydrogenase (short-subunit alcohol dehydrogenase family)
MNSDRGEPLDLTGRRALITGASSGLGAHFASILHAAGASVILVARRLDRIQALAERLSGRAEALCLDVTDAARLEEAFTSVGKVDIVVNNAGTAISKPALDQTEGDWDQVVDTNLKGVWLVATAAARAMRAAGVAGSIINIASILGIRQSRSVSPYAISKAGVLQLTKQLALELARFNIRVNAVAPGYFVTELNQEFFSTEAGRAVIDRIPQRRLGQLNDLDGVLLLLASDASRYMTGAVIAVDGGYLVSQL